MDVYKEEEKALKRLDKIAEKRRRKIDALARQKAKEQGAKPIKTEADPADQPPPDPSTLIVVEKPGVELASLPVRLARVIDTLKRLKRGKSLRPQEIYDRIHVNITRDDIASAIDASDYLARGPRGSLRYVPELSARDARTLLAAVRDRPYGIQLSAAKSAYHGAEADIRALVERGDVWEARNSDTKVVKLFALRENDDDGGDGAVGDVAGGGDAPRMVVAEKTREMWRAVKSVTDAERRKALAAAGIKVAMPLNKRSGPAAAKRGKKRKAEREIKMMSNAHLSIDNFSTGLAHAQAAKQSRD